MNTLSKTFRLRQLAGVLGAVASFPSGAEIVLLDGGGAISVGSAYVYAHPSMRSVVFASPQARDMAILPPTPYFLNSPPLLLRAPAPYVAYPPVVYQSGVNATARPSNSDVAIYSVGRAHAFSQGFYDARNYGNPGALPLFYAGPYNVMPYYPPPSGTGKINDPVRPSNRDNASYNLERAHRFEMDAYKKPR